MHADAREACSALFRLDPQAVRCPYPILDDLRESAPLTWFDEIEAYAVTRYDLVLEVLRKPELYSSRGATGPITDRQLRQAVKELIQESPEIKTMIERRARQGTGPVLVLADPPVHSRQRALVNRAFNPSAIRALEPDITALTESLVDAFESRDTIDLVREYSVPIPMTVIAVALGVELERMNDFKRWSDGVVSGVGRTDLTRDDLRAVILARSELEGYLLEVMQAREENPQEDLISRIVNARVDGERLTTHEAMDMIIQFLVAGNETTAKLITASALRLAADPTLANALRDDPSQIPGLIEEVLRLEPPSTGNYRITTQDCELGGVRLPAGTALWLVYAAANRDARSFEDPEACVIGRSSKANHLAFGMGAHYCIGAGLARVEARIAIDTLLRRFSSLAVDVDIAEIEYENSYMVHGIRRLPLRVTR